MITVITGASSGIGLALATSLLSKGHVVYSLSRTAPPDSQIRHIYCDVSDRRSVVEAFREFHAKETQADILVNNAGFGISGAAEFADEGEIKRIFDVNFLGAVYCTQCAIPKMREARGGKILFISSAAAVFPIPFQSFYTATKSAISAFCEGLRMELEPFGIQAGTILLCDTKTGFTANRKKDTSGEEHYSTRVERSVSIMEHDEQNGMSADKVAEKIARYLGKKRLKGSKAIGSQFGVPLPIFLLLNRILPRSWVTGILYRIYAK